MKQINAVELSQRGSDPVEEVMGCLMPGWNFEPDTVVLKILLTTKPLLNTEKQLTSCLLADTTNYRENFDRVVVETFGVYSLHR
jgi:hypothetical protein